MYEVKGGLNWDLQDFAVLDDYSFVARILLGRSVGISGFTGWELGKWRGVINESLNWDLQDYGIRDSHASVARIHFGRSV